MDRFCKLCFMLVYVVLSCLFVVALWSPAGKGLTSWLSCLWRFVTFPNVPWFPTGLSPPVNSFTDRSKALLFVDLLCYLCLEFVMFLRRFIAALWSPVRKGMTTCLSFVMFNCVLSLSHVIPWVRCGT